MGDIIIQQFNPVSKCWNTLHKIDKDKYDAKTFIPINRYGGPYRTFGLDEPKKVLDFYKEGVVGFTELEEVNDGFEFNNTKKTSKKRKTFIDELE